MKAFYKFLLIGMLFAICFMNGARAWYDGKFLYSFDEDTDGYLNDSGSLGNNYDLKKTGTITYVNGVSSLLKNASNYTQGANQAVRNFTNINATGTLEYWFNISAYGSNKGVGFGAVGNKDSDSNIFAIYEPYGDARLGLYFAIAGGAICNANDIGNGANSRLPLGVWNQIIMVWNGTSIAFWLNGTNTYNCSAKTFIPDNWNVSFGPLHTDGIAYSFSGSVDNGFWTATQYTPTDVADAWNSGAGKYYGAAIGYDVNITEIWLTSPTPDVQLYPPFTAGFTNDNTPTFNLTTNISSTCSYANDNATWAACATTGSTGHICTEGTAFSPGYHTEYFKCVNGTMTTWINATVGIAAINATLVSPNNNTWNTSTPDIEFKCYANSSISSIGNISLSIWNATDKTLFSSNLTTGLSGQYAVASWINHLRNGNYTWNCQANDSYGNSEWATYNRTLTLNSTMNISQTLAEGGSTNGSNYTTTSDIHFNCYANSSNLIPDLQFSFWNSSGYYAQGTITHLVAPNLWKSIISISGTSAPDGNYTWNCNASDKMGLNQFAANNWTFYVDTHAPQLNLNYPTATIYNNSVQSINYSVIEVGTGAGAVDDCWYSINGAANLTLAACANLSNVNFTNATNTLRLWVNDTFGNVNTTSVIFNIYGVGNINYTSPVNEGDMTYFYVNISANMSVVDINASFSYNQTSLTWLTPTKTYYDGKYGFTQGLTVPIISLTGVNSTTAGFAFNFSIGTNATPLAFSRWNDSSGNQTITILNLDNCTTYAYQIFNFSFTDEINDSTINIDTTRTTYFDATFKLWANATNYKNFSFDMQGINKTNYTICINSIANKAVQAEIEYKTTGYDENGNTRFYQILNSTLVYGGNNISLYGLNDDYAPASPAWITVRDEDYKPVQNVYIKVRKYYIGTNLVKNITWSKITSDIGDAMVWLKENDKYIFEFWRDNILLDTQEQVISSLTLNFVLTPTNQIYKYGNVREVNYTLAFSNLTNVTTYTYDASAITSGEFNNTCLVVSRKSALNGKTNVCTNCSTDISGILTCSNISTEGSYYASAILSRDIDDSFRGTEIRRFVLDNIAFNVNIHGLYEYAKENSLFIGITMIITMALAGLAHPVLAIMLTLVGFVFCAFLGLIELTMLMVVGVVVTGLIIIFKMRGGSYQ